MQRRASIFVAVVGVVVVLGGAVSGQQAPAGRGAAPAGRGQAAGRGAAPGGGDAATRPALLFEEKWQQPPYTGALTDENRRVTQAAITNPNLELKLYGAAAREIGVYSHEGRLDLWTGMATSPVAFTFRHKTGLMDLTGLARLRTMVRTQAFHVLHPVVKLADGTLIAGSQAISTDGQFLSVEVAFTNLRWFRLDPEKVVTLAAVMNPDLSKVDEVGLVNLAPSGGHGTAGYANISTVELFAKTVPR